MRIQRVIARAFGPFHGATISFGSGMTVVAGPNEAGKSSWHAATRLALTGLRRGRGRATRDDAAIADRHRPWDNPDEWSVEALVHLDDGRIVEIRQDLAGKVACSAIDVGIGRDVSDEILDGTPDASRWLGLDREAFATTVSVSQAQVLAVSEAAGQLQEQMQRAAATRGTDATASQAIERLSEFRREAVGADTIAARGPLRAAKTRLAMAHETLGQARSRHADYLERGARAEQAERRLSAARLELDVARWSQAAAAAEQSAAQARRARELAARHPEPPAALADRDEHADRVAAALDAWERRPAVPALSGPTSAELEAELRTVPSFPAGDLAPDAAVLAATRELDLAEEALRSQGDAPAAARRPSVSSDQLRALARRLRQSSAGSAAGAVLPPGPPGPAAAPGTTRLLVAVGLAFLAAAVGLAMAGAPLAAAAAAGIGLVIAGVALMRPAPTKVEPPAAAPAVSDEQRSALAAAVAEAEAAGLPPDADRLDRLADEALQAEHDHHELARWMARRDDLAARRELAIAALRGALDDRAVPAAGDVREASAAYLAGCERRARLAATAMRREPLERELAARRQAETAAAAATSALAECRSTLAAAASLIGLAPTDEPTAIAEGLRAWQQARASTIRVAEAEMTEWRELEQLLHGGTLAGLADDASRRLATARQLEANLPAEARETPTRFADLETAIAERSVAVSDADRAWHELKGALDILAPDLPDVAAAEEEATAAEAELRRIEALAATIDETLRLLRAAQDKVHRDLAPILADAVRRWLPSISGGAYTEVSVDPADLSIQVKEARTGAWREAKLLSEGTREQIYLLLRVAMAQHLVTTGETAPLLLDEVTAQADGGRRDAILSMLHAISRERQVILFSHDAEVAAWAEAHLEAPDDCLLRLPALTTPGEGLREVAAVPVGPVDEPMPLLDAEPISLGG